MTRIYVAIVVLVMFSLYGESISTIASEEEVISNCSGISYERDLVPVCQSRTWLHNCVIIPDPENPCNREVQCNKYDDRWYQRDFCLATCWAPFMAMQKPGEEHGTLYEWYSDVFVHLQRFDNNLTNPSANVGQSMGELSVNITAGNALASITAWLRNASTRLGSFRVRIQQESGYCNSRDGESLLTTASEEEVEDEYYISNCSGVSYERDLVPVCQSRTSLPYCVIMQDPENPCNREVRCTPVYDDRWYPRDFCLAACWAPFMAMQKPGEEHGTLYENYSNVWVHLQRFDNNLGQSLGEMSAYTTAYEIQGRISRWLRNSSNQLGSFRVRIQKDYCHSNIIGGVPSSFPDV